tara:strand:- start:348 stop:644 length:297 start_codon:yes stop_codon:yes gene_type:complete
MTIFIGNLSWETEEEDLKDLFTIYGEIRKCIIPLDRDSGRKRGFGFVEMTNKSSEKTAIEDLQDVEWMGREIRVYKADQRDRSHRIKRLKKIKINLNK